MVVQLGVKPNRMDRLTGILGVTFEEAWATRSEAELDGVATRFIGGYIRGRSPGRLRPYSLNRFFVSELLPRMVGLKPGDSVIVSQSLLRQRTQRKRCENGQTANGGCHKKYMDAKR